MIAMIAASSGLVVGLLTGLFGHRLRNSWCPDCGADKVCVTCTPGTLCTGCTVRAEEVNSGVPRPGRRTRSSRTAAVA